MKGPPPLGEKLGFKKNYLCVKGMEMDSSVLHFTIANGRVLTKINLKQLRENVPLGPNPTPLEVNSQIKLGIPHQIFTPLQKNVAVLFHFAGSP